MNPFPIVHALARRNWLTSALFLALIAIAVALGVAIIAQERSLREGSARASDPFDVIVAAPGSRTELLFSVVYLRPSAVELIQPVRLAQILSDPDAGFAAPVAFGDSAEGFPVVGTTVALLTHVAGGPPAEGRLWRVDEEAVIGAKVPFEVGDAMMSAHGTDFVEGEHGAITVVGKLPATGTAWDAGVFVPIQYSWSSHGILSGGGHAHGHDHEAERAPGTLPEPLHPEDLGPAPAVVMKTDSLAAAYGLRQRWNSDDTDAFFPAEVLTELYAYLGDVRTIMSALTVATQALVVAAILSGVVALMQLYRNSLAILRALGATRGYVFLVIWCYVMTLIVSGALLGLMLGYGVAQTLSARFATETGMALSARIGWPEARLALILVGLGAVLAILPPLTIFRKPAVTYLR